MQSVALFEDVIASNPTNTENRAMLRTFCTIRP